jgi:hypothetical protein
MSTPESNPVTTVVKRPYEPPVLRTFGTVTALTQTTSRDGRTMDGGPNNVKT